MAALLCGAKVRMGIEENRRPIAARRWRVSQAAADWLVRRGAGANAISLSGMAAGVLAGLALWSTAILPGAAVALWLAAALLIQLRLVANMLDGMVAIGSGTASKLGELGAGPRGCGRARRRSRGSGRYGR